MNEVKPGFKTTEFWIVAVVNIITAVIGLLAIRGFVTAEEGEIYIVLGSLTVAAIVPLVMSYTATGYAKARAQVKTGGG